MNANHVSRPTTRQAGFSLVELMVALLFMSLLMAGMLRVFGASLNAFASSREALDANRAKRWAIGQIDDDLQMGGYFFPIRSLGNNVSVDTAAGQNALMVLPDQTVTYQTLDLATNQLVSETVRFDEVQFVTDQPLPIQAQLAAAITAKDTATLTVISGNLSDVRAGDAMIVYDSAYEAVRVLSAPTAPTVTLDTSESVYQDPVTGATTGINAGFQNLTHQAGAAVLFIRPMQVVRYTILPLNRDPADANSRVPCLVRDQQAYPANGSRIVWPAYNATPAALAAAGVTRTVIAENVAGQPLPSGSAATVANYGLRVDVSLDRGQNWERTGAASWPALATKLNTRLATVGTAPYTSVTSPSNPIWFRYIPALLRVEFTTRTVTQRQDPQNPTQRVYRYRGQSLMVSPRNYSLGA